MIFDFNVAYRGMDSVPFKERAELAVGHLLHIPERILNIITQIVKAVLFGLAAGFAFGQSDYLNDEFLLAGKRVAINAVGLGTSLLGFFAPLNATKWQAQVFDAILDPSSIKQSNKNPLPYLLAV